MDIKKLEDELGEIIFARGELDAIIIALPFEEHGIVSPPSI